MAPRNDGRDGANGSDEPKSETGHATMATLRYGFYLAANLGIKSSHADDVQ